jgi:hypothetical protein
MFVLTRKKSVMTETGWKKLGPNTKVLSWDREIDALSYMVGLPLTHDKKRGVLGAVVTPVITKEKSK